MQQSIWMYTGEGVKMYELIWIYKGVLCTGQYGAKGREGESDRVTLSIQSLFKQTWHIMHNGERVVFSSHLNMFLFI